MTPLDDEFVTEEARQCAIEVKETIKQLVRIFGDREMQLKLKQFEHKSNEFAAFQDTFGNMQHLYNNKMCNNSQEV